MRLKPGTRLESAACDTQVVVVRAPKDEPDVDLRCGGQPMREAGSAEARVAASAPGEPTVMGKRYADDDLGVELLCTQGGEGTLTIGDTPLVVRGAKPLPSSD
ncbi:MAG TPA: hypothetical protein VFW63_13455 [Acidimicrobiales bacterium]|nr:hypothetical protein [Acidimicrobiales bacterium]